MCFRTAGCLCALFVALVSVRFSAAVTEAWLLTTLLGLLWKLVIFDPIKALCCGALLEPFYACLTCDLSGMTTCRKSPCLSPFLPLLSLLVCMTHSPNCRHRVAVDALLEVVEETVEMYTEDFTGTGQDQEEDREAEAAIEYTRRVSGTSTEADLCVSLFYQSFLSEYRLHIADGHCCWEQCGVCDPLHARRETCAPLPFKKDMQNTRGRRGRAAACHGEGGSQESTVGPSVRKHTLGRSA